MTKIAQISDKSSSVAWSPVAGGHEDIVAIGTKVRVLDSVLLFVDRGYEIMILIPL